MVGEAGRAMEDIVSGIQHVSEIMAQINVASSEQEAGIEQINKAIIEMDGVTQQNAALVEEAAASAGGLERQSSYLAELVSVFKVDGAAGTSHTAAFSAGGQSRRTTPSSSLPLLAA